MLRGIFSLISFGSDKYEYVYIFNIHIHNRNHKYPYVNSTLQPPYIYIACGLSQTQILGTEFLHILQL